MKGKIYFFGLLLMLLVLFIAAVQGINWGIENSWTPDNVKNDPLGAFNTNPDRAVSLYPPILDGGIAKRWFNEGDIAKHIQLQPSYAKTYFEGNGLEGLGGEEYVKYATDDRVKFIKGRSDITISEKIIKNNKVSLDLAKYEQGTIIEPDGTNGFKVITPGKGEVSIVADTQSKIDYDAGTFIVDNNKFGAESVSKIKIEDSKNYLITTADGRVVKVFSESGFKFSRDALTSRDVLTVDKGSKIIDTANNAITDAHGITDVTFFGKEGYLINGNFLHEFNSEIGGINVPSKMEVELRKKLALPIEKTQFCYKCGLDVNGIGDKTIIFDGKEFYSSGKVSLSIANGNEVRNSAGIIDNVVYKTNGKEIAIIKNPDRHSLRLATIESIEKKMREGKLKNFPKLSDQEIFDLKREQTYSEVDYINGYKVSDIDKQAGFETLVVSAITKGNTAYVSGMGYNIPKDGYDLKIGRFGLFSDAITGTEKEPVDYSFKVKGKEKWKIGGEKGNFYEVDGKKLKQIDYYTDAGFDLHRNDKGYAGLLHGEAAPMLEDFAKDKVGGWEAAIAASGLRGKDIQIARLDVGKNSLSIESIMDEELINKGGVVIATVPLYGEVRKDIGLAQRLETTVADNLKNADSSFIKGKIGRLAEKVALPKEIGQALDNYVSNSLASMQQKVPDRVMGFRLNLDQQNPSQARISGILIGSEYSVVLPTTIVGTHNTDLMAKAYSNLEAVSQQKDLQDVIYTHIPELLKSFIGK